MASGRAAGTVVAALMLVVASACTGTNTKVSTRRPVPSSAVSTTTTNRYGPSPTTALPSGARFVVTPSDLVVGGTVTFSGTGCPRTGNHVAASVAGTSSGGTIAYGIIPSDDGSWRTTTVVSDSTQLGMRTAFAACDHLDGKPGFGYPSVDVVVRTWRRLRVAPATTLHRGASLAVHGVGGCPLDRPRGLVILKLKPPGEDPSQPGGTGPEATADPDAAGNWSGTLEVPADTPPGRHVLSAYCTWSRSETAWYPGVPITVT